MEQKVIKVNKKKSLMRMLCIPSISGILQGIANNIKIVQETFGHVTPATKGQSVSIYFLPIRRPNNPD